MPYLELLAGLILLVLGGDVLVRGAVSVAGHLGVSPLVIGLTLVGFGTSTPELFTSVEAALRGSPGIAIGNVVGSNIANILLILGLAALIHPLATPRGMLRRDGTVVLLAAIVCVVAILSGHLARLVGAALVATLCAYIFCTYRFGRAARTASARREAGTDAPERPPGRLDVAILFCGGGLVLTLLGANFLVDGSIALAASVGVSETLVGLTVVAIGTSLPELATSVAAAVRRHDDVAVGNVVGSNIFNVLGILGATAVVKPIPVPPEIARLDIWVMLAATVMLLLFAATGWRISRLEGAVALAAYAGYLGILFVVAT